LVDCVHDDGFECAGTRVLEQHRQLRAPVDPVGVRTDRGSTLLSAGQREHIVSLSGDISATQGKTEGVALTNEHRKLDSQLVDRALRAYGEAINLVEPLRVQLWHERGLTIAQIGVLFLLHERDGRSIGELGETLRARPATVTGLADRLERGGFVLRRGDEFDRRVVRVVLTPEGRQIVEEIRAESRGYLGRAFESLGAARVTALADLLMELVRAADSPAEAPAERAGASTTGDGCP